FGLIGGTVTAGLIRFLFEGTETVSVVAGAFTGLLFGGMQRVFVNRPPWQPAWARRSGLLDARRWPPWTTSLIMLWALPIAARQASRGVIDQRWWQVAWGAEFVLYAVLVSLWMWRYWSKVQVLDREWEQER